MTGRSPTLASKIFILMVASVVAICAFLVGLLAMVLAWHAWAEPPGSIGFTVLYGIISLGAFVVMSSSIAWGVYTLR